MYTIDYRYAPRWQWTAICRPDDPYKTLVREDGALIYNFKSYAGVWHFNKIFEFELFTDHPPITISQEIEAANIPIVVTRKVYPRATLVCRAFSHATEDGQRADVILWHIEPGEDSADFATTLWLTVKQRQYHFLPYRPENNTQTLYIAHPATEPRPAINDIQPDGIPTFISTPAHMAPSFAPGFADDASFRSELSLASSMTEGCIIIPLTQANDYAQFDYEWAQSALTETRKFWRDYPLSQLAIQLPDPEIMALLTSAARNIMQAREIKNGLPEFQVGATCYRSLWIVDGHFMLEAVRYLGLAQEASHGIDALLRRVRDDGSITQYPDHIKETGISLATLVRQTELTDDWNRLKSLWHVVQNAVNHIKILRKQAHELPTSLPGWNLLPPAFGDGGMAGKRAEFTTALWMLFGLKEATRAANILGYDEDAIAFQEEFDGLMTDFREHANCNIRTLPNGLNYLPMWFPFDDNHHMQPGYEGEPPPWKRLRPESATWALCQSIYPGEVFAPDDPLVQNLCALFDLIDDEQEIPATTGWQPYQAVWAYAASFAAHVWLYTGRSDKAIDYLYGFANHATPMHVWREEQSFVNSDHGLFTGDMPHNWASAEFIRLVRNLLVLEYIDRLEILRGLPTQWIDPQQSIYVEATPTRFGPVHLRVTAYTDGTGEILIKRDLNWSLQPLEVRLYTPINMKLHDVSLTGEQYFTLPTMTENRLKFTWTIN